MSNLSHLVSLILSNECLRIKVRLYQNLSVRRLRTCLKSLSSLNLKLFLCYLELEGGVAAIGVYLEQQSILITILKSLLKIINAINHFA